MKPATTKTAPLQIYIPTHMLMEMKIAAARVGATASAYTRQAIVEKVARDNNLFRQQQSA